MSNQQLSRTEQLKPYLIASQRQIQSLLVDEVKAKRFLAASLVVASSPQLSRCTPDSIVQALIGVAMSDLNVDSNIGHCYIIPYGDKAQLQIGYKGMIQLLFRAGWLVKAFPVYNCDQFTMEFDGWSNKVTFIPEIDARNEGDKNWVFKELRGIYVVARHTDTKDEYSLFVNKTVIEKLRLNSPDQKNAKDIPKGIWFDWYQEMATSKAIKRLAKILPLGDRRVAMAIYADDKTDTGNIVDFKRTVESGVLIEMETEKPKNNGKSVDDLLNKSESGQESDDHYALGQILDAIGNAADLGDIAKLPDLNVLNPHDFKIANAALNKKIKLIKSQMQQSEQVDWKARLEACEDKDTLELVLSEMPEDVQVELSDAIDLQFDRLR